MNAHEGLNLNDTIIAVSTPPGFGGLGIVRLSGSEALPIAKKFFKAKRTNHRIHPQKATLGFLYDPQNREPFEEAYLTYFPAPWTYTREDVVEISCHGSPVVLEEAVRLGIQLGARHARPGEFTLRAFLSGRIDMTQAEAIHDFIHASSFGQAKITFRQLSGSLSKKIRSLRAQIIHVLSQLEASIEFPDEGLRISPEKIAKTLKKAARHVKALVDSYDLGKAIKEGITLAIVGKPNTGKSTLFNALLEDQRAIVTPFPGTTRDFLKERMRIKGMFFTLIDMAGISRASHPIEKEGIKRGKKLASQADGILLLLDSSQKETPEDFSLLKKYNNKKGILLFNKIDLPPKINTEKIENSDRSHPKLDISALKGTNLSTLKDMIHEQFVPHSKQNEEVVFHLRQKFLLEQALESLSDGLDLLDKGYPEEMVSEEIRKAALPLSRVTGEIRTEEVLQDIFERFCVGK